MEKIKVLLVDDHNIVRNGIKMMIQENPALDIIGEASNGKEAIELILETPPDVVISDITMPEMNGLELTEELSNKFPDIKVLILTMHEDEDYVVKAFEVGALGYLPKDSEEEEIIKAITKLNNGDKHFTPQVSEILAKEFFEQKIRQKG